MSTRFSRFAQFALGLVFFLLSSVVLSAQKVTITPGYVSVGVGGTVQYTASVSGLLDGAVTWLVSGVPGGNSTSGTISSNGVYTAPAQVPLYGVTVAALGSDQKTYGINYVNIAAAGPSISAATPNPVHVGTYTVTLTGSGFKPGARVQGAGSPLSSVYINDTTIRVSGWQGAAVAVPFQVANPDSLWGAPLAVAFKTSTPLAISPQTATLRLLGTQQFTADGATKWTATAGSISQNGLYTAPEMMPDGGNVTIVASGADGTASATVTVTQPQTISPAAVSVSLGATQQFVSAGATSWTATLGTISATGLYTAPSALLASGTGTVTASGLNGSAVATLTLVVPGLSITSVDGGSLPLGIFSVAIHGSGFNGQSVVSLDGTPLSTTFADGSLAVSGFIGRSGTATLTVSNGAVSSNPFSVQVGVANALASAAASRRFLEQAAFGPTPTDAAHVQTIGQQGWLNEQLTMAQVSNYNSIPSSQGGMPAHFLAMAVSNPDQLRQRVAFALSQIFVTSLDKLVWNDNMIAFQNMLLADSFTNYRKIMADVTLSSAMGQYLDMANNAQANAETGSVANENYARELMQLFTIGTNQLNLDGSIKLDGNNLPMPNYTQATIAEMARVCTGWTYAPMPGQAAVWNASWLNHYGPMVAIASQHDFGSKQLLNGAVAPAGLSPQADMDNALDNIFNHPSAGPFVGRLLIQHLVKSNPSPAYIARVAAAFNNNGKGVRGDMQAVVTAVLLDPEARANDDGGKDLPSDGHLQEPALYIAGMVRAFGGQANDQNWFADETGSYGEKLFNSPSVFNFFSADYAVPGASLNGAEFQIYTPNNAILRAHEAGRLIFSQWSNPVQSYGPGTTIDLTPYLSLASTPATLVDALDLTLTHGLMPAPMKSEIVAAVQAEGSLGLRQVQTASYLILTSNYYNVWH